MNADEAREFDAARLSEARNGPSRAYCRLYVSKDGGSEQPETPDAPRCWLQPGHDGRCQPAPFHTGGVVTSTTPAVLAPRESRWSLSVDHGARDASIVMVEHTPAGPRPHPASRPHEATAFVYIDEPPDPASYMLTLARAANQTGRPAGSLLSRVVRLADARRDAVLARERARPSILLALPAEPEGDDR